jgi:hypothetical protein
LTNLNLINEQKQVVIAHNLRSSITIRLIIVFANLDSTFSFFLALTFCRIIILKYRMNSIISLRHIQEVKGIVEAIRSSEVREFLKKLQNFAIEV